MIEQSNNTEQSTGNKSALQVFMLPVRVYYEDTDAGGVVYHSNYINYFERARTEWLRQLGYEQDQLAQEQQLVFVVRSVSCDYLRPARFNDELFITAELKELGKTSITFTQKVIRSTKDKLSHTVLSEGEVVVVAVDSVKFKPKRIPRNIRESIQN